MKIKTENPSQQMCVCVKVCSTGSYILTKIKTWPLPQEYFELEQAGEERVKVLSQTLYLSKEEDFEKQVKQTAEKLFYYELILKSAMSWQQNISGSSQAHFPSCHF